jgi:hypothetical protein
MSENLCNDCNVVHETDCAQIWAGILPLNNTKCCYCCVPLNDTNSFMNLMCVECADITDDNSKKVTKCWF